MLPVTASVAGRTFNSGAEIRFDFGNSPFTLIPDLEFNSAYQEDGFDKFASLNKQDLLAVVQQVETC